MLSNKLQELLDILWTCGIEGRVVDVYDDLFKVVVLLLPLEQVLSSLIIAEVLEEDQHCQVFEVALLYIRTIINISETKYYSKCKYVTTDYYLHQKLAGFRVGSNDPTCAATSLYVQNRDRMLPDQRNHHHH